jgi:chromosome segregation ATPase
MNWAKIFKRWSRQRNAHKEQIHGLERTLRQQVAIRPIIEAKDDRIAKLEGQLRVLEEEKHGAIAQVAVTKHDYHQQLYEIQEALEDLRGYLQRKIIEFEDEHRTRTDLENKMKSLQLDLEILRAKVEERASKTQILRDVITERGASLAEKDQIIAHLTKEVQLWRQRLMDAIEKYN